MSDDVDMMKTIEMARLFTQPGSAILNCLVLFGSMDGGCAQCMRPCLHPLASSDIIRYFNNSGVSTVDWIDDSMCVLVCKNSADVQQIVENSFSAALTEESGIVWYKSKSKVPKVSKSDKYGAKGKGVSIIARSCLTSDIEQIQKQRNERVSRKIKDHKRRTKLKKEKETSGGDKPLRRVSKKEKNVNKTASTTTENTSHDRISS